MSKTADIYNLELVKYAKATLNHKSQLPQTKFYHQLVLVTTNIA